MSAKPARADESGGASTQSVLLASVFGVALFLAALFLRVIVARAFAAEPVWDGHYYDFGAKRIAAGLGYSDDTHGKDGVLIFHPWCHYPVGYSAYLAAFYRLFGETPRVLLLVNAATGAALAPMTWLLSRHAFSETRAKIAGVLVAICPGLVVYSALVMTEELAALSTLLSFYLAVSDKKPLRGFVLASLALGVSALVRPQALLCAPFLVVVLFKKWAHENHSPKALKTRRFAFMIVACSLALVPVLPWSARNCLVMDGCALVSTNGGWNLAIGAFPRATGRFETLRSSDGCREVTGQVQQDRCWFHYGVGEILAHPVHWLSLAPKKLAYTFDHESFAVGYLHEARPDDWPEERAANARGALTLSLRLLTVFAALGVVSFSRGRKRPQMVVALALAILAFISLSQDEPHVWPLAIALGVIPFVPLPNAPAFPPALLLGAALVLTTALTHAIFFGEDRYHVAVLPVFCMFLAGALRRPFLEQKSKSPAPDLYEATK